MATTLSSLLPPTPQPRSHLLTPTTTPIPANASTYNHLHTPILVVYYALRVRSLVSDPLHTMMQDLLPVALAQCVFCATCLPQAGTWGDGKAIIEGTSSAGKGKGNPSMGPPRRKGKKEEVEGWGAKILPTFLSLLLTLIPPIPLTLLALTLGAPLFPYSSLPLTLLLCTHISLLSLLPIFYTHGVNPSSWADILSLWVPFDHAGVWGGSVGAFVGGWLGAIPIALDWDREWQAWPVTVLVGVIGGWAVGRMLTGELGLGVGLRIGLGEGKVEGVDAKEEVVKKAE